MKNQKRKLDAAESTEEIGFAFALIIHASLVAFLAIVLLSAAYLIGIIASGDTVAKPVSPNTAKVAQYAASEATQ